MSSGSYFPPPVRTAQIPKNGGERTLGIPTVGDRVAQMVVKLYPEPEIDPIFHPDSYGYRPGKSALDAVAATRTRCWRFDWVVDLDIKGFFGNIDHELMMKAVCFHTDSKWIQLYIERWLKAPAMPPDGTLKPRNMGTPQGGVISPLLANLFLHYAFDAWMKRAHPESPFARYADDIAAHCKTQKDALHLLQEIKERLGECRLELHPVKTKIVYCKDDNRRGDSDITSFDFLGYTFRPGLSGNRWGKYFVNFSPAISHEALKTIYEDMRERQLSKWSQRSLEDVAAFINPVVRGWINYYGRFCPSALHSVLLHLNRKLTRWVKRKYKRFKFHESRATHWLGKIAHRDPALFAHWRFGVKPSAGQ